MITDRATYQRLFEGFVLKDGTFGFDDNRIGLLLVQDIDLRRDRSRWETRFIGVQLDRPMAERFVTLDGSDLEVASLSCAWMPNQPEFVLVDTRRQVWSCKPGEYAGSEAPITCPDIGGDDSPVVHRVVRVGTTVYAVGSPFSIYERLPGQQWRELADLPKPTDTKTQRGSFYDLTGGINGDLYAVGSAGTILHHDGACWRKVHFPTKNDLHTVAVADNGDLYVTEESGCLWRRTGVDWTFVCKRNEMQPFFDTVWFRGRLWCSGDTITYILEDDELVHCIDVKSEPPPVEVARHGSRLDVSPDGKKMLVCGHDGAVLFDGEHWTVLFAGEPPKEKSRRKKSAIVD